MIPASYLYKDIYRQTWLDPDIECAKARQNSSDGGGRPIRSVIALLTRMTDNRHHPRPISLASDPC